MWCGASSRRRGGRRSSRWSTPRARDREVARATVDELCEALEAEVAFVVVTRPDRGERETIGHIGPHARRRRTPWAPTALTRAALRHRAPAGPRRRRPARRSARAALALSPWTAESGRQVVIGVARLYDEPFDAAELALLEAVTDERRPRARARLARRRSATATPPGRRRSPAPPSRCRRPSSAARSSQALSSEVAQGARRRRRGGVRRGRATAAGWSSWRARAIAGDGGAAVRGLARGARRARRAPARLAAVRDHRRRRPAGRRVGALGPRRAHPPPGGGRGRGARGLPRRPLDRARGRRAADGLRRARGDRLAQRRRSRGRPARGVARLAHRLPQPRRVPGPAAGGDRARRAQRHGARARR